MNNLFETASNMTDHLSIVSADVMSFIDLARNSTLVVDPSKIDHSKVKVPQAI